MLSWTGHWCVGELQSPVAAVALCWNRDLHEASNEAAPSVFPIMYDQHCPTALIIWHKNRPFPTPPLCLPPHPILHPIRTRPTEAVIALWPLIPLNNILMVNLAAREIPPLSPDYSAACPGLGLKRRQCPCYSYHFPLHMHTQMLQAEG